MTMLGVWVRVRVRDKVIARFRVRARERFTVIARVRFRVRDNEREGVVMVIVRAMVKGKGHG